ncbi:hypothetical protein Q9L58_009169 [Maublancomyces gigas]|uniref:Uncharacterized protein n=1 Tax=Discina gigas TaxID=1032678 RepID=A0ABR3G826_9PEZI
MKLHNLFTLTCLLLSSVLGSKQYRLKSGELFTAGEHDTLRPNIEPEQGSPVQVQALLARQVCYAPKSYCSTGCCAAGLRCCDQASCINISTHTCCSGGIQCLIGKDCCGGGCCKAGGECCSDNSCCGPGDMCVINTVTGERGCLPKGSVPSSTTSRPVQAVTTTTRRTTVPICLDPGYGLCADQRFCCPIGSYCYYDTYGYPSCWNGNPYYTFYYYYSWSYSFGVRWYTATTSYNLGGTNVAAITTPPRPTSPQPTSNTVTPPTNTKELVQPLTTPSMALPPGSATGTPTSPISSSSPLSKPASSSSPSSSPTPTPTTAQEQDQEQGLGSVLEDSGSGGMRPAIPKEALVVVLAVAFVV